MSYSYWFPLQYSRGTWVSQNILPDCCGTSMFTCTSDLFLVSLVSCYLFTFMPLLLFPRFSVECWIWTLFLPRFHGVLVQYITLHAVNCLTAGSIMLPKKQTVSETDATSTKGCSSFVSKRTAGRGEWVGLKTPQRTQTPALSSLSFYTPPSGFVHCANSDWRIAF